MEIQLPSEIIHMDKVFLASG